MDRRTRPKNDGDSDLDSAPESEILDTPLRDLGLRIADSPMPGLLKALHAELTSKGLEFCPTAYLSTEWFVEKGECTIGAPFWLAHPRLQKLEEKMMLDVEGATALEQMRILRHEAGHALDHAFRLHARRDRQSLFGKSSTRYPESYRPKPYSRRFVRHLPNWYAQSHPDEDFAESFAVWLDPDSKWRERYLGWPGAMKKLQWMEATMNGLRGRKPTLRSRRRVAEARFEKRTLNEIYAERLQARSRTSSPEFRDEELLRVFLSKEAMPRGEPAGRFVSRHRRMLREAIAEWAGIRKYNADRMLDAVIERSKALSLVTARPVEESLLHIAASCVALGRTSTRTWTFSMES